MTIQLQDNQIAEVTEAKITYADKTRSKWWPWTATRPDDSSGPQVGSWKVIDGGQQAWCFDPSATEFTHFSLDLPEDYKSASDFDIEVHWVPTQTEASSYVVWRINYTIQAVDSIFGNSSQTGIVTTEAGTADTHRKSVFTFSGTGRAAGDVMGGYIERVGGHGSDDYDYDAAFLGYRLTYTSDKRGS